MIEDTRTDVHGEACSRIAEGVEKEVSKMTLKDVVFEITELKSNSGLFTEVLDLCQDSWRKDGAGQQVEDILNDLVFTNLHAFIFNFGLEEKVREMLIETMIDREVSDL